MNLCVIGTGYVGLVSGVCFAELGNKVICVDIEEEKIRNLNNGIMPIYESDLEDICNRNRQEGRIEFTTSLEHGVKNSEIIFIAVGTPSLPNGQADLSAVEAVATDIAKYMNGYKIIVNKSTVPVGTQKWVTQIIKDNQRQKHDFDVVSNPEFLREGTAVYDTMNTDRVVIGSVSHKASKIMTELHEPFNAPVIITDPESAEMIKYAANAFLATKITFINEIANICEKVGADVKEVAKGIGLDRRISNRFLEPGVGYGGACFPKDTKAIVKIGEKVGYDFEVVKSVIRVNEKQKLRPFKKLEKALGTIEGKRVGILGLSFKPNTDDMREAPSIDIICAIQNAGGTVKAYDPIAMDGAQNILRNVEYANTPYDAVKDVDAVILVTEWKEFEQLDLKRVKDLVKGNIFIDGRNVFNYTEMKKLGFEYYCIGRRDDEYYKHYLKEVAITALENH
ncbi:UDP-glucose dehydrogenase family protein [Anaerosolibacter sp.]|uniref:UDP-glucose dehydrogenase family protein n=1 Tax=Anaerosolibacter sp. TaxID=1872527 RepID=UPI0039EEA13C